MHTLCVAKSWIPTVFCALKVLSHDLTLCMCTACATTVVGRSLYHYPYVWDTNLPTTVSLPQSMKTGTGWKGWNSRKFPKFRAVVGSKISAYWTSLTIPYQLVSRISSTKPYEPRKTHGNVQNVPLEILVQGRFRYKVGPYHRCIWGELSPIYKCPYFKDQMAASLGWSHL